MYFLTAAAPSRENLQHSVTTNTALSVAMSCRGVETGAKEEEEEEEGTADADVCDAGLKGWPCLASPLLMQTPQHQNPFKRATPQVHYPNEARGTEPAAHRPENFIYSLLSGSRV